MITKPDFWENRYQENTARWDIGEPAPGFVEFFTKNKANLPLGKVAVLGCGRGHDALFLAQLGFDVWGFDFAPSAIQEAKELANQKQISVQFEQRDIFYLPDPYPHFFDYILEHTCFCAIPPEKRDEYVKLSQSILKPNGQFIGIFFTHNRLGGPPFGITPEEIKTHFQPHFQVKTLHPVTASVPSRQGDEHLGWFYVKE